MKQYGDKQWRKFISVWMELAKLRVTAHWGPLAILVRGRERINFICPHFKLGWSQNISNTPVGFTLTIDNIHWTKGEFCRVSQNAKQC